ncbi:macro domain-containing protein [Candidatus Nitrospira neomarina]|uniref:macro domain-containing protein n=1 Tax=Candidatus Nitrospira neomarina TaxID=3020899 RepID=UPI00289B3AC3|nr:macro domain-containing protein [Candidatus Nitrospira neomarina]
MTISRMDWRSPYRSGGPRCTKTYVIIARFPPRSPASNGVGRGRERADYHSLNTGSSTESWGQSRKAPVENINHCLKALRKTIESEKFSSVVYPRLATGVGGLDWKGVKSLIEKHLGDVPIPVYVYSTYHPGVKAKER